MIPLLSAKAEMGCSGFLSRRYAIAFFNELNRSWRGTRQSSSNSYNTTQTGWLAVSN
jgi:hypothetical protein